MAASQTATLADGSEVRNGVALLEIASIALISSRKWRERDSFRLLRLRGREPLQAVAEEALSATAFLKLPLQQFGILLKARIHALGLSIRQSRPVRL